MSQARTESQTHMCYSRIRRMLLHRQIQPGARMTETAWTERIGVNRSALREALNMLAHEGLLSRGDNGGFFAPVLSKRDLEEIIEVRMAMELGAIRLLALKDSPSQRLEDLRAVCLTMEQALEANLDLGFEEADRRFHEVLVDLADNARLSNVYQHAPLPVLPSNELDEEARRKSRLKTQDEHRRICDLLEAKDYKRVADLLEQHLMTSYHILPIVM